MNAPKVLAFAGSARKDSFNKKLLKIGVKSIIQKGLQVTCLDLRDWPFPLYDGDLEAEKGIPEIVAKFKELMKSHQGFLLACPEYNSSITPLLKNTIDWASRPAPGEPDLLCFRGKFAGLISASPGALGGLRGLVTVRSILENIGVHVIPTQMAVPKAHEAFDENGNLKDGKMQANVEKVGIELAHLISKFHT